MKEYLLLVFEFFKIKGLKGALWNCGIPVIITYLIFEKSNFCIYKDNAPSFHSNLITMLCVLIGFTISTLTILLTVNNPNIELAKTSLTDKILYSKPVTVFESIIIGLAYIILIQCLLLIANLIYPIFVSIITVKGKAFFAVNISIMIHIILILLRNILDFYFIVTRKK